MPQGYQHTNKLKTCSISIWNPRIPRICLARKPTFGNWFSWHHHQDKGSTHVNARIDNLLNKKRSPTTRAQEDSSMDAPIPNILSFFFLNLELGTSLIVVHVQEVGVNWPKQAINSEIIVLHHI
jgi:hypothetical protein